MPRMSRGPGVAGVAEPLVVASAILRQRNDVTADGSDEFGGRGNASPTGSRAADEVRECPLCMEPYADDASERHVPRILTACGHTVCQGW